MFCINCGKETKDSNKFCTSCGKDSNPSPIKTSGVFITKKRVIFAVLALLFVVWVFWSIEDSNETIASSVVNIYCENDNEELAGGSGTIMTDTGLVLTNAHIIPENISGDTLQTCVVILPDPQTGAPKEMYYAYPIVFPDISERYDLAFIQIDDVYVDDEGVIYGDYPKLFPAYDNSKYCVNENVKLGESVRIYGYPAISGGVALTITDGVVSSLLLDEGLIITSAKISSGNSGGLAVDEYGCRIGIPAMVTGDEYESLGIIISNNLIADFTDEATSLLELGAE